MRPSLLLVLCLFWLSQIGNCQTPKISVENIGSLGKGLSDQRVISILNDKQGFIWIGSTHGLNRFDGYDYKWYPYPPERIENSNPLIWHEMRLDIAGKIVILYQSVKANKFIDIFNPSTGLYKTIWFSQENGFVGTYVTFIQDRKGNLYFLSSVPGKMMVHRYDENQQRFSQLFSIPVNSEPAYQRIAFQSTAFYHASTNDFWFYSSVFADFPSLHCYTAQGKLKTIISSDKLPVTAGKRINFFYETIRKELWASFVGSDIFCIRLNKEPLKGSDFILEPKVRSNPKSANIIREDHQGNIILFERNDTEASSYFYLIDKNREVRDRKSMLENQGQLLSIYSDDFSRWLLMGSSNGIKKVRLNKKKVENYLSKDLGNVPFGTSCRGICPDGRGNIIFATETMGWFQLNKQTGVTTALSDIHPNLKPLQKVEYSRDLFLQGDSAIYGNNQNQLIKYVPSENKLFRYKPHLPGQIESMMPDKKGMIWIAYESKLVVFDPFKETFGTYTDADNDNPMAAGEGLSYLRIGRNGNIWVGSNKGLFRIDPVKRKTKFYQLKTQDSNSAATNKVMCIHEDADGLLWIGLMRGGVSVFDPKTEKVIKRYTFANGLSNDDISAILPVVQTNGKAESYWISSYNGLSYLNIKTNVVRNFLEADGLSHNEFNRFSSFYDSTDKRYYFGGMNGINSFLSHELAALPSHAPIMLTELSKFDEKAEKIVTQNDGLQNLKNIILEPGKALFMMKFAMSDYQAPQENKFSYRIEGIDNEWNMLGNSHELRLDYLPPGNYTLHVRGSDPQGNWSKHQLALQITAKDYWYNQKWAWLIYLPLAGGSTYYFYRFQLARRLAIQETLRLRELDEFKSHFFTNISHEFRTPLTVILGTTEQIQKEELPEHLKDKLQNKLAMIMRHGNNLFRLINEILDLAKIESKNLKLNFIQGDIVSYIRYLSESLHSLAGSRNISIVMENEHSEVVMDYDPEQMLHIVYNLLSNAIKFTSSGGVITITTYVRHNSENFRSRPYFSLVVSDTGNGISPEDLPYIFDRYFQAKRPEYSKAGGSGIGLALTKEIVKLLHGEISAKSTLGIGSVFTVNLPVTNGATETVANLPILQSAISLLPPQAHDTITSLPSLLIIEDNSDVVTYLADCLSEYYNLDFAYNGEMGIEKAVETIPDLILSDVMMPVKDGLEVCDFVKNDERTSHIPIVLLTAKTSVENRIVGLKRGADAYLAKPFNLEELLVTLSSLLRQRQKLQAHYSTLNLTPVQESETPDPDVEIEDIFLRKLHSVIESRLDDPSLSVNDICMELGMSPSVIYRKLTALTGESLIPMIRSMRLRLAKKLLKETELSIRDISMQAGFEDPKFFSRIFSQETGMSPSAFRNQK